MAGKTALVAYEQMRNEEAHECAEGCGCESSSAYLDQVQQSLADLGSADPAGDVARNAKDVRGAKKAKLEPKQAAAMIMAMSQRDPADYQPRYRYEDVAGETAHEYVAVDSRGRKVFGPSKDYEQAKRHAAQAGGVVHFVMASEAGEPRSRRPLEDVYQEDRAQAERAATQALSALGIQYTRLSEQQRMMSGTFVFQATGSENTPAPPGYPGLARMPFHVEVYKKTTTVARGMASMQTFPYGYRGIGAREDTEAGEGPHAGEGASEAPKYNKQAYLPPGYEQWERGFDYFPGWKPKRHHQSYAGREWDEDWQVARGSSRWNWGVMQNDATSWSVFAIDRHGHQYHVAFAGSEADAKHKAAIADTQSAPRGSGASEGPRTSESCACGASDCVGVHTHGPPPAGTTVVAAAEGEGTPHYRELDLAPPPAPLEPYTKELRWHRDPALDSTYHAESPLGRFTVLKRTPDRRHDVLPWQVLRKGEPIGQADDKAGAYKVAAKFARSPNGRASKRVEPAACVAVVERTPGCMPTSTRLDSPKDAFEIMKGRYARQGHETFEVLGSSVQGFMVGSPITVAVGDTTSVQVSVTQVLAAAIGLAAAGATTVFCIHGHPSGKAQPSDKDRDLTRAIKAGFRAALPNVKFGGHIVAGQKTFSLA